MDMVPGSIKNFVTLPLNFSGWGPKRSMPAFAGKSFSAQMKKGKNKSDKKSV
jgi:hypothetical protein